MARLIDANEIEELFYKQVEFGATDLMDAFDDALQDAQTVDAVEVVHGEWLDSKFVRAVKGTNLPVVQCSKCECYFCDVINNHHYMYHYCPNCGAKMDGDGNA